MNPTDKNRERAREIVNAEFWNSCGIDLERMRDAIAQALDSKDLEHSQEILELRDRVRLAGCDTSKSTEGPCPCLYNALTAFDTTVLAQKARKEGKG